MNETRSSNSSFIEDTRAGTLVGSEVRAKEARTWQKEKSALSEENGDFSEKDTKAKPKEYFSDVYEGEWFVDAEEDEELADTILQKHGFGTKKQKLRFLDFKRSQWRPKYR